MSKLLIPSHRTLNDSLKNIVFDENKILNTNFGYYSRSEQKKLSLVEKKDSNSSLIFLTSETNEWNPQVDNLICEGLINFKDSSQLFGIKGIAHDDASIGIAVKWNCKNTKSRGIIFIDELEIKQADSNNFYEYSFSIESGLVLGLLQLTFVLFLKETSIQHSLPYGGFSNTKGTLLGVVEELSVMIDGNGPLFPIKVIDNTENDVLWDIDFNITIEDFFEEEFDENVMCLYINQKNPYFPELQMDKEGRTTQLFREIIAQSLILFVESIRLEYSDSFLEILDEEFEPGSVGFFLQYLQNNCSCNFSNLIETSKTIRQHAERTC